MDHPFIIAYYLPQYHPTKNNDIWWGKGFTEWTNVGKAKALFRGHYQPKVPADLGYYDLRLPEVREDQARLAKDAGVGAFCYYHYWFGNGTLELERPLEEVLRLGEPDFPFCMCWANESWHSKFWNIDGTISKQTLVEQVYPGDGDIKEHFDYVLPFFKDNRYLKIDNKPVFVIYRPLGYSQCDHFIQEWNRLARQNGFAGIYFVGYSLDIKNEYHLIKELGFDAVDSSRLGHRYPQSTILRRLNKCRHMLIKKPYIYDYDKIYHSFIGEEELKDDVLPTIIPNWDHTPRSGNGGYVYSNSTPENFRKHLHEVLSVVNSKKNKLCFLKSWNEWGEGNYVEPDLKYGHGYLDAIWDELNLLNK